MSPMKCLAGLLALAMATLVGLAGEDVKEKKDKPKEIVINVDGKGGMAKYIEEGKKDQEPVTVSVGQKVTWKNKSKSPHTATSDKMVEKKPLWTTKELAGGKDESDSVTFDQKLFEAYGGKPGGEVTVDYHCDVHPEMKAKLILKSAAKKDDKDK
jgi:plastocyanin